MNPVKGDVVRFQNISNSPYGALLCIKNEAKTVPGPCKRYRPIRYVKHWAPASCVRPLVRFICTRNACTYRAARFLCFLFQRISVLSWSQLHYWLLRLRPVSVPLRPTTPPLPCNWAGARWHTWHSKRRDAYWRALRALRPMEALHFSSIAVLEVKKNKSQNEAMIAPYLPAVQTHISRHWNGVLYSVAINFIESCLC